MPNVTKASVRIPRDYVRYPLKVCGDPTTTVRPPCVLYKNVQGLLTDMAQASYDIHLKSAETYSYRRIIFRFYQNVDKRQIKKSYDAHMNCKHIPRSPLSPTMSKKLGKIADRKILQ